MAEDWTSTARNITRRTKRQNNTPVADPQTETQTSHVPAEDITPVKEEGAGVSIQERANANETRHRNFKRPRELKSKAINVRLKQSVFNCLQEIMQNTGDNVTDVLEKAILAYHSTKQGLSD